MLAEDAAVLDAIARLPKAGGTLTVLVSLTTRDRVEPLSLDDARRIAGPYAERGLDLVEARSLRKSDVHAAGSTWGKRLRVGDVRPGIYMRFVRARAADRALVRRAEGFEGERDPATSQATSAGSSSRSIGSSTLM